MTQNSQETRLENPRLIPRADSPRPCRAAPATLPGPLSRRGARTPETLLLLALFALLAGSPAVLAQGADDSQAPPKVLNIFREFVKVGKDSAHDQHEAAWLKAMHKANYNTYVLTMTAVSGEPEEWFMSGYNTFAAWEKDNRSFENNHALAKVMAKYGAKDADYISSWRRIMAVYRPDLSYKPDFKLGEYRYFNVRTITLRMGSGPEEVCKILAGAVQKGNLDRHWVGYEVVSGAPMNTYLFLLPVKTAAEWDNRPNEAFAAALKEANWEEAVGKAMTSGEDRLFSFNPRLSHMPESVVALDPAFWHPESRVAKGKAKKGSTQ